MAKAYNQTTHFQTRSKTTPEDSFVQTLAYAKEVNADVITLVGDIFSFPSELAIEWVLHKLDAINIPMCAPGKNISYGCRNPNWNRASDR